jgi:hypothetical protein
MSLEHAPQRQRKRGRPKGLHRGRRLTATVNEWCNHTGMSRNTAFRQMAAGTLRFVQVEPGAPRRIPLSEYTRHGYDLPTDDDFIVIKPKNENLEVAPAG